MKISHFHRHRDLAYIIVATLLFLFPFFVLAANQQPLQPYVPLVTIPGVENTGFGNLPQYLNQLYLALIAIGALIAVVKIIMAGVKWSFSGIVTDKADAKSDIRGALLGLAILLAPYVVLNEINPELTNFNFFRNLDDKIKVNLSTQSTQGTSVTPDNGSYGEPINYDDPNATYTIPLDQSNDIYFNASRNATCVENNKHLQIRTVGNMAEYSCVTPSPAQGAAAPTVPSVPPTAPTDPCNAGNCTDMGLSS